MSAPTPQHDKVPNLKLVMNPEGKCHDWTDLPENEVPEVPGGGGGNHAMVDNLQACKGRGKIKELQRLEHVLYTTDHSNWKHFAILS